MRHGNASWGRREHRYVETCHPPLGRCSALACGLLMIATSAQAELPLTEADYYEPLPQVLTVTRLAQPLDDVPGAVTVIDRETSAARPPAM